MAFTMKDPPEFTLDVRQWDRETDADGVEIAKDIEKLLNNDAYLKDSLEELEGNAVVVGDKGVPDGVASLGSDGKVAQHVDYSKVDNVPAMTWGNVTGKPASFPPSAHTHTKSEVGLSNVDNTADASKRVSYATSAGEADTLDGKHASAFALASHSHSSVPNATNATNADTVDGFHASQTAGAKNACVVTNPSGYIMGNYFNSNISEENPSIGQLIAINTSKDGFFRKVSLAHLKAQLGLGTFTLGASVPAGAKFTDTTYGNMKGATASAAGAAGLVPAPASGAATRYLRSDGTWQVPPDTNTTYSAATQSAAGLMSAADKKKLDGVAAGAQVNPGAATQSAAGLMSAADKKKLDGVAAGAQVNPGAATQSAAGLMSAADKTRLDKYWAGQMGPDSSNAMTASGNVITAPANVQTYLVKQVTATSGGYNFTVSQGAYSQSRAAIGFSSRGAQNGYGRLTLWDSNSANSKQVNYGSIPSAGLSINLPSSSGTLAIASSDIRLKDKIEDTFVTGALSVIEKIKMRQFDWKDSGKHQKIGFIADELEELDEHFVLAGTGGYEKEKDENGASVMNVKCVDTFYLQGYEVKAIQELHAIVTQQAAEIDALKEMIRAILPA